jgi:hypothetical protein
MMGRTGSPQRVTYCRAAEHGYYDDMSSERGNRIPVNELVVGQVYTGTVVRTS